MDQQTKQKIDALEARIKKLESALQITPGGVVLTSPMAMTINAASVLTGKGGVQVEVLGSLITLN